MELLRPCMDASYGAKSVAYTGTAGTTLEWPPGPQGVLIWCTSDAFIRVGQGVTATTADTPIPANTPVPFNVPNPSTGVAGTGGPWVVSAVQISAGGTLYAKPINIR
ncbi:hypothetical protein UFOVP1355_40 [uncultured Caudovirales phage]|uniref:Uncharacterized protein n=1 Tax=uncultured Caudovirales phage TaxID=2100421 RepID=A0A6J5RSP4_9CAUD|nr:hypothetical protein UFOVP1355_40 [uncultured Caudovirales phage]